MFKALIGTVLLAATTALYAQTPAPADAPKGPRHHPRVDCSKEQDPKACETRRKEMREKMKAMHAKARQACEGKKGDERRACMVKQGCAQSADPAKCEANVKDRMEKRKHRMEEKAQRQAPEKK
jgi:Spy/CpxP family protein refolding chaperone